MAELYIGDRVWLGGRAFQVRGLSPMGADRHVVELEDPDTSERVEVPIEYVRPEASGPEAAQEDAA
jgi:hypothetical protein